MIEEAQRKAARVYAITYPLMVAAVIYGFNFKYAPLLVPGHPAQTAHNIMGHSEAFRAYLASSLLYGIGILVMVVALSVVLRPISRWLTNCAAICALFYGIFWLIGIEHNLAALRIVGAADYLSGFEPERLQAMAGLQLATAMDAYYIGLTFFGMGTVAFCFLWFRSRYIPRALAVWGMLAAGFEGVCAAIYLIAPAFGKIVSVNLYELPIVLFEITLCVWLLAAGLRTPGAAKAGAGGK